MLYASNLTPFLPCQIEYLVMLIRYVHNFIVVGEGLLHEKLKTMWSNKSLKGILRMTAIRDCVSKDQLDPRTLVRKMFQSFILIFTAQYTNW